MVNTKFKSLLIMLTGMALASGSQVENSEVPSLAQQVNRQCSLESGWEGPTYGDQWQALYDSLPESSFVPESVAVTENIGTRQSVEVPGQGSLESGWEYPTHQDQWQGLYHSLSFVPKFFGDNVVWTRGQKLVITHIPGSFAQQLTVTKNGQTFVCVTDLDGKQEPNSTFGTTRAKRKPEFQNLVIDPDGRVFTYKTGSGGTAELVTELGKYPLNELSTNGYHKTVTELQRVITKAENRAAKLAASLAPLTEWEALPLKPTKVKFKLENELIEYPLGSLLHQFIGSLEDYTGVYWTGLAANLPSFNSAVSDPEISDDMLSVPSEGKFAIPPSTWPKGVISQAALAEKGQEDAILPSYIDNRRNLGEESSWPLVSLVLPWKLGAWTNAARRNKARELHISPNYLRESANLKYLKYLDAA